MKTKTTQELADVMREGFLAAYLGHRSECCVYRYRSSRECAWFDGFIIGKFCKLGVY